MRQKFSHEYNTYVKYKSNTAWYNVKHNSLEPNYANVAIKNNKVA